MPGEIKNLIWNGLSTAECSYLPSQTTRVAYDVFVLDQAAEKFKCLERRGFLRRAIVPDAGRPRLSKIPLATTSPKLFTEYIGETTTDTVLIFNTPRALDGFVDDLQAIFSTSISAFNRGVSRCTSLSPVTALCLRRRTCWTDPSEMSFGK